MEFDQLQNFQKRRRIVRDLIDRRVLEPHKQYLIAHLDKIGSIVTERDKIIHGLWGSDDDPPEALRQRAQCQHAFNWSGPKPNYNWHLTYDGIMRVALKIDALSFDLQNYLAAVMGYPKQFVSSEALRKISRPLDPPRPNRGLG